MNKVAKIILLALIILVPIVFYNYVNRKPKEERIKHAAAPIPSRKIPRRTQEKPRCAIIFDDWEIIYRKLSRSTNLKYRSPFPSFPICHFLKYRFRCPALRIFYPDSFADGAGRSNRQFCQSKTYLFRKTFVPPGQ